MNTFQYYNCLKLDVKAIQTDAQTRIQLMADNVPEITSTSKRNNWSYWPNGNFCFPGSEIPEWVSYQNNEGSSLTIDMPPHWNNNFFGLVLCIVASCDSSDGSYSLVDCTSNFIDSDCYRQEKNCSLKISQCYKTTLEHPNSDHVTTWEHPKSDHKRLLQGEKVWGSSSKVQDEYSDESTESGDHDIAEEDSQKRIKQRNIVHEQQPNIDNQDDIPRMSENFEGIIGSRSRDEEHESRSGSDNMDCGSGDDQDAADNLPRKKRKHRHIPYQIQSLEARGVKRAGRVCGRV
ncbi:hypothetical protein LWI28_018359 [Acer negundo]|uniref:C-JID domain-containing protein n=1 Tax=Acer negundo TaxID=4023 RepID=A0AAD5JDR5_ACENE|nr:hypothetical protein LWI28_018359 [Acer negundo]